MKFIYQIKDCISSFISFVSQHLTGSDVWLSCKKVRCWKMEGSKVTKKHGLAYDVFWFWTSCGRLFGSIPCCLILQWQPWIQVQMKERGQAGCCQHGGQAMREMSIYVYIYIYNLFLIRNFVIVWLIDMKAILFRSHSFRMPKSQSHPLFNLFP